MRVGFAVLEQGVKRDTEAQLRTKTLLKKLFDWFASPSPKDSPIVAAFALASAPRPLPSDTVLHGRSGLDGLAMVIAAFNDLLAASTVGRNEAALAFIERVSDPDDYVVHVRIAARGLLEPHDEDEFVNTARARAERLNGPSHPSIFSLVLFAISWQFQPVDNDTDEARKRRDKGTAGPRPGRTDDGVISYR